MGEGESLQGEREERNVELLVYTELTSIRDKLRVRRQLHLSTKPLLLLGQVLLGTVCRGPYMNFSWGGGGGGDSEVWH